MPETAVIYFCELDGSVPVLDWLKELARRNQRAAEKCIAQIDLLRQFGHELRRPTADYLRDKIYELRVRTGRSQHRILFFYHGQEAVVLAHGLTKEKSIPSKEIERAILRMRQFNESPALHTYRKETFDG